MSRNVKGGLIQVGNAKSEGTVQQIIQAMMEKTLGPSHEDLVLLLLGLAQIAREQHDTKAAIRHGERALAIRESSDAPVLDLAEARLALARSLWLSQPDRPRARALAEQAAADLHGAGAPAARQLAEAKQWLADHSL